MNAVVILTAAPKRPDGRSRVTCRCFCGTVFEAYTHNVKGGRTKSCGCARKVTLRRMSTTHGATNTSAYAIWSAMIQRCKNTNDKSFGQYGGRGIRVCNRWRHFDNFLADMGQPSTGMSLDRINNDGNYEPANCRWTTRMVQRRNNSHVRSIQVEGKSMLLVDACEKYGVKRHTAYIRLYRGWSVERALEIEK